MSDPGLVEGFQPADCGIPFPEDVREKGRELFRRGNVRLIEQTDPRTFDARVPFFRRHHRVWLHRAPDGTVTHGCTCPVTRNDGHGCEHLFGLLLAIGERLGAADDDAGEGPPLEPLYAVAAGTGGLRLRLLARERPEDAPRPVPADGGHLTRVEGEPDRRVLARLAPLAGGRRSLLDGGGFEEPDGPWTVPPEDREELLLLLAATGRLVLESGTGVEPLAVDPGEPADLVLRFEGSGRDARLRGWLVRGPVRTPLAKAPLLVADASPLAALRVPGEGLVLAALRTHGAAGWLRLLARREGLPVGAGDPAAVLSRLAREGPLPRVWLPGADGPLPLRHPEPRPRLLVTRAGDDLVADLRFVYDGEARAAGAADGLLLAGDARAQVARSPEREAALARRLDDHPAVAPHPDAGDRYAVDEGGLPRLLEDLICEGFEARLDGRTVRRQAASTLGVRQGHDWLELAGGAEYGGVEAPAASVLAALEEGRSFVTLPDGSVGLTPGDWPPELVRLLRLGREREGRLELHPAHGELLAGALPGAGRGTSPLAEALSGLRHPRPAEPAAGFRGTLRDYQRVGVGWLNRLASAGLGGCLADDMGLGKTVQVAAWLCGRPHRGDAAGTLVAVPRSVLGNWAAELARFAPELDVLPWAGQDRERRRPELPLADVVLTTHGTLRRDADLLATVRFGALVLDEAQAIKNPRSLLSRAVRRVQAGVRVALTGTPVENHAGELWSLLDFLNPGLAGPRKRFLAALEDREGAGRALRSRLIAALLLRRTKEEAAPDLPPRSEQLLRVPLAPAQRELYGSLLASGRERLRRRISADGLAASGLQVLETLLRLRQAACHPALVDPGLADEPSGKLDLLAERLEEVVASGHKALVFSQFTSLLDLVARGLDARGRPYARLDGRTRDRETPVARFQESPGCPILLASLKAGGVGLNLTAADYVFLLDPWWNPAAEAQAVDRAHRMGRERPVVAYRLVAEGTVEEGILELQETKRELVRDLVDGSPADLGPLTAEDLELLLGA